MIEKKFKRMRVDDLVPYENNPRIISEKAIAAVVASINECDDLDPIEIDENNIILSGHTRRLALLQMGYEYCDVVQYIGLNDEQKQKYRILANKTGEFSEWDFEKLDEELSNLDFEFDFGFVEEAREQIESSGSFEPSDFKYENQYGVTVVCGDEQEQERVYNWLTGEGYNCKVVTV